MKPRLKVTVTRAVEPLDFDAWAAKYVRLVLGIDAASQKQAEAA